MKTMRLNLCHSILIKFLCTIEILNLSNKNMMMKSFVLLVLTINSFAQHSEVEASDGIVTNAGINTGLQHGNANNPDHSLSRLGGDGVQMMNQLCKSKYGGDYSAVNLGPPPNGSYIGWCLKNNEDGNVYRCQSDAGATGLCAGYSFTDCKTNNSLACALATPPTNGCEQGNMAANPCNVATGNKYHNETVFTSGTLTLSLNFNSQNYTRAGAWAYHWSINLYQQFYLDNSVAHLTEGNGRGLTWEKVDDAWVGGSDTGYQLTETIDELTQAMDGLLVTKPNSDQLFFIKNGTSETLRINKEVKANGNIISYEYSSCNSCDYILVVTDEYGGHIEIVDGNYAIDGEGNKFSLNSRSNRLVSIGYPRDVDGITAVKTFHYENTAFPYLLTGITDENGDRYATYAYDVDGNAITSEHAPTTNTVGQAKFEFDYQGAN